MRSVQCPFISCSSYGTCVDFNTAHLQVTLLYMNKFGCESFSDRRSFHQIRTYFNSFFDYFQARNLSVQRMHDAVKVSRAYCPLIQQHLTLVNFRKHDPKHQQLTCNEKFKHFERNLVKKLGRLRRVGHLDKITCTNRRSGGLSISNGSVITWRHGLTRRRCRQRLQNHSQRSTNMKSISSSSLMRRKILSTRLKLNTLNTSLTIDNPTHHPRNWKLSRHRKFFERHGSSQKVTNLRWEPSSTLWLMKTRVKSLKTQPRKLSRNSLNSILSLNSKAPKSTSEEAKLLENTSRRCSWKSPMTNFSSSCKVTSQTQFKIPASNRPNLDEVKEKILFLNPNKFQIV